DMEAHAEWKLKVCKDDTLFIYIIEGEGYFEPDSIDLHVYRRALLFNEGEEFYVKASDNGIHFLLFSAKPLNEPVAWGGPIVMNTKQELDQAFAEINNGTFILKG
ncbi:MAG: pirin family protein, partial [Peptostreptococcaceae bacterium]|nr:pirin family protein [Peptostreptococcaceae bacterium]